MTIQGWQTVVRLSFQKCNFPIKAEDKLQRDIFVIGLNDTYKHFRSEAYITNHEVYQVQSNPKGIFVDLDVCSHHTTWRSHRIEFQVDSGCSCNTMHTTDLEKLSDVDVMPSPTRLFDYSKATIPTKGQAKLNCSHWGSLYEVVVQIITSQQYHPPLLGLANSMRMGVLKYDADKVNQVEASQVEYTTAPASPPGELTLQLLSNMLTHIYVRA